MTERHKYADLIIAWANGEVIEQWSPTFQRYIQSPNPSWLPEGQYRVKPKEPVIKYAWVSCAGVVVLTTHVVGQELKLTFDPDTGKLLTATVL
jgi:hypothetical protein